MCTNAVMNTRLMNHDTHREAKCINHNVFLAPFDFLVPAYVTAGVGVVGRIDTSGINDSDAGRSLPSYQLADDDMEVSTNSPKTPSNFPLLSSRRRCFHQIHDSIHNLPKRVFSLLLLRIQDNFSNLPLFIRKVG